MRSLKTYVAATLFAVALGAIAYAQGFLAPLQNGVPASPSVFGIGDATSGLYFGTGRTGISKHVEAGAVSAPALSSCGTSPTLATNSSDTAGTVTMGTTATGCVITFGTAYTAAPTCLVTWIANPLAAQSWTTSTTAITTTQTSTSNNILQYFCIGKQGG